MHRYWSRSPRPLPDMATPFCAATSLFGKIGGLDLHFLAMPSVIAQAYATRSPHCGKASQAASSSAATPTADAKQLCFVPPKPDLVSGLLLFSYPLHPPRKPEQLRIQHLPDLRTPSLFVHGTRDPFASSEEMKEALALIPAKNELLEVEGAGHDLGLKGKSSLQELPAQILAAFQHHRI